MYEYLRPDTRGENMHELQDLFNVKLNAAARSCTVNDLSDFMLRWDTCLTGLNKDVDEDTLYPLFLNQIEHVELIEWKMKSFDDLPEKEKTYNRLYVMCQDLIVKTRKKENSRLLHNKSKQKPLNAAAAPEQEIGRAHV